MTETAADESDSAGIRAQSTPLGFLLVISIVIAGASAVVILGDTAITDTRGQAELQRAEHSMTLFDSRAAMVALGSSRTQSVQFGSDSGQYSVAGDAGWIAIKHVNYSDDPGREVETIYNQSLGALQYTNGDTAIAYQGGGVWRVDNDGRATMVSPPEFHYRASTLTLPIIQVRGNGSGSGAVDAEMRNASPQQQIFPNSTDGTADGPGAPYDEHTYRPDASYRNPIENGSVYAWVHSEYYLAWAEYFRERTTGNLTVYDHNQTVRLELVSLGGDPGTIQPVPSPGGDGVQAEAFGSGHPIEDFSFNIVKDTSSISNTYWSIWVDGGSDLWEFNIHFDSGAKCQSGTWEGDIELSLFYRNISTGQNEEWEGVIADPAADDDTAPVTAIEVNCDADPTTISIDLTNDNTDLEYGDFDATGAAGTHWHFSDEINNHDAPDSVTLDQHPGVDGEPNTFDDPGEVASPGSTQESVNFTVNHYLSRMDTNFEIRIDSGSGNSPAIDEPASVGELRYVEARGSQYITFLHITENEIEVSFD